MECDETQVQKWLDAKIRETEKIAKEGHVTLIQRISDLVIRNGGYLSSNP